MPVQRDHASEIAAITHHPAFKEAVRVLEAEHDRTIADIITLTEIPAPPCKEEKRAAAYLEMLQAHGREDVEQDETEDQAALDDPAVAEPVRCVGTLVLQV